MKISNKTSEAVGDKTVEAILNHPKLEEVLIYDDEDVEPEIINQINKHTEDNKRKSKQDDTLPSSTTSSSTSTLFFKSSSELEDEKEYLQKALNEFLEIVKQAMKGMSPDQQEEFKRELAEAIRNIPLPLQPDSPECKS